MYDAGVSLNGLACFVTPDLARDLANDVTNLVSACQEAVVIKIVICQDYCTVTYCTLYSHGVQYTLYTVSSTWTHTNNHHCFHFSLYLPGHIYVKGEFCCCSKYSLRYCNYMYMYVRLMMEKNRVLCILLKDLIVCHLNTIIKL